MTLEVGDWMYIEPYDPNWISLTPPDKPPLFPGYSAQENESMQKNKRT